MDTDLVLTLGIIFLVLSIPSLLAAWAESRAPRLGALMIVVSAVMIVTALMVKPGGYAFQDVPSVMLAVGSRWFN